MKNIVSANSIKKKDQSVIRNLKAIVLLKIYIITTIIFGFFLLFIGYVYTYIHNPNLFLPGISDKLNPIILRFWGQRPIPPNLNEELTSNLNALLIPKKSSLAIEDFTAEITWLTDKTLRLSELKGNSFLLLSINKAFCGYCANTYPFLTQWEIDFLAYKNQFPLLRTAVITISDASGVNIERDTNRIIDTLNILAADIPVGITSSVKFLQSVHVTENTGVPLLLLIDRDGLIRYKQLGIQNMDIFPYLIAELVKQEIDPNFKLCLTTNYFGCRIYR